MGWRQTRDRILPKIRETQQALRGQGPNGGRQSIAERRKLRSKLKRYLLDYAENVPIEALSRCPICESKLEIRIDTLGLDGPWWWSTCPVEWGKPLSCEHFRVFLGAVDLHGRQPTEVDLWTVFPGPGAPFVVERLLAIDGMRAVISTVELASGDTGYLIAYFSDQPTPDAELHQEWRRESWFVFDDAEEAVESVANDPWEFDLDDWLESGKLVWISPGDRELEIHEGTASPYRALPGTHKKQVVLDGRVELDAPPDGSESGYYEPLD